MTKIFRIVQGELLEQEANGTHTVFLDGDCYLVDAGLNIFLWIGQKSTVDERFAVSYFAKALKRRRGDIPRVFRIEQGDETDSFLKTLPGKLEVQAGGSESLPPSRNRGC
jgi:hypothetical protein